MRLTNIVLLCYFYTQFIWKSFCVSALIVFISMSNGYVRLKKRRHWSYIWKVSLNKLHFNFNRIKFTSLQEEAGSYEIEWLTGSFPHIFTRFYERWIKIYFSFHCLVRLASVYQTRTGLIHVSQVLLIFHFIFNTP